MKLGDVIKIEANPAIGYEIDPEELIPNGKWVETGDGKYEQRGLVKDIIGTAIRMRQNSPLKYKVNVFVNTDGRGSGTITWDGGTVVGSGEYYFGEFVTLGAVANSGFEFTHWQDGNTENPRNIEVVGDMDFIANFKREQLTYTIQVIVKSGQSDYGIVSGGGSGFQLGESVRISAMPNDGYEFKQWDDGNTRPERTVYVGGDKTYIAEFAYKQHKVRVKSDNTLMGTVTGGGVFNHGEITTIGAIPGDDYLFRKWNDGSLVNPREIVVDSDKEFTAFFKEKPQTTALIIVRSSDDLMGYTIPAGTYRVSIGDTITLEAVANDGYEFKQWDDGDDSATREITVTGNATYTAHFKQKTTQYYTLLVSCSPNEGGTIRGGGTFVEGTECNVEATPNDGYEFVGWDVDIDGISDSEELQTSNSGETQIITIPLTGNARVTAKFNKLPEPTKYSVLLETNPVDGGDVYGSGEYTQGTGLTVSATPAHGYTFVRWVDDNDVEVSTEQRYSFIVDEDKILTAEFRKNTTETHSVSIYIVTNNELNNYSGGYVEGAGETIEYEDGETCNVSARNNKGFEFDGWVLDDINNSPISKRMDYSFPVVKDTIIYAKFKTYEKPKYAVTVDCRPDYATVYGGGSYDEGTQVTVGVDPNTIAEGYELTTWIVNDREIPAIEGIYTYSFEITSATEVIAILTQVKHIVTTNVTTNNDHDDHSGGYVTGAGTYNEGAECTITAFANKNFIFMGWLIDGVEPSEGRLSNPYIFTVAKDTEIIAEFITNTPTEFEVTTGVHPDNSGIVTGGGIYSAGTEVEITATPNNGYEFDKWMINGQEVSQESAGERGSVTKTITVNVNTTVIAYFKAVVHQYTVSTSVNPVGSGVVTGGGTYNEDTEVTLVATPNSGYEFDKWMINGQEVQQESAGERGSVSKTITINANTTVVAYFKTVTPTKYNVSTSVNPIGSGTVTGDGSYDAGTEVTLVATPNSGYEFDKWMINGQEVQQESAGERGSVSKTITINANTTVVAYFKTVTPTKYNVSTSVNPIGSGTVTGDGSYDAGTELTLIATPATGYEFDKWMINGQEVQQESAGERGSVAKVITVNETKNIIVYFKVFNGELSGEATETP